jgi:hypothetical protein
VSEILNREIGKRVQVEECFGEVWVEW